ncbi:MAG TPA: CHC2 zinc finger domain-containing protein [Solirubrobacteraceae bacterium]|nr:CHC2 zinc finger domain-containing protein [Solirubrobacteraceae bacterium]
MKTEGQTLGADLRLYLELLAGQPRAGQFFNLRWLIPPGVMGQQFISARRIDSARRRVTTLAKSTDVFLGVALRDRRAGGKAAISGSHLLYIECDQQPAGGELAAFAFPPTMEIASGTPEHRHLYWQLDRRAANLQVESANRRLAQRLGGELACVDIARLLRPPETFNYKDQQAHAVRLLAYRPHAHYTLPELLAGLPDDPRPTAQVSHSRRQRKSRTELEQRLLAVPAAEYVRVLTGREPNRASKVLCPFHEERDPSLHLYPDGTFYCYGRHSEHRPCAKGGTIFDFAAALWNLGTRERDFLELSRRLAEHFGLQEAA